MEVFTRITIQSEISLEELESKSYLILTNINQTPPHCSLLCNQLWYSLNYEVCKINIPYQTLYKTLTLKNSPAIFLELSIELDTKISQDFYLKYKKIDFQNHITCITPIKEILNFYKIRIPENAFLFKMIALLYQYQKIKTVHSFKYNLSEYRLKHYSCLPTTNTTS